MQVQSGALDYNSAIRQSVKRMADSGLRTVDYASGWSNHLDVAVRRATLTGANQMSGKLTDVLGEEMACNFVECHRPRRSHETPAAVLRTMPAGREGLCPER